MPVVTLSEESVKQGAFYVPRFEIKVAGANLPLDVLRDVIQVTYNDDIKKLDGFELSVNNWDTFAKEFRYVGSETLESLDEERKGAQKQPFNPLHRLFEPCRHKVEVFMGYGDDLKLMLAGNFTTMEPSFPSSGAPTLTVRGLNLLHKLRTEPHSYAWPGKKESQIAKSFEKLPDPDNPGKKLPVLIDEKTLNKEENIPYVAQSNQFDIDFLLERARRAGYVVFIKEAEKKGDRVIRPRGLYFGPSDAEHPGLRPVTFELKWGISLIDFKPTLTTANQIRSVTVNGWNVATKQPIVAKKSINDQKLNLDLHKLLQRCDAREERVVDEPMFTQRQANQRALAILLERSKDLVKTSGTCVGLPDLRAGQRVRISNVGARFSGEYFITDTTHTISDSGYITKFNARREDQGKEKAQ
jgi:phage protein D